MDNKDFVIDELQTKIRFIKTVLSNENTNTWVARTLLLAHLDENQSESVVVFCKYMLDEMLSGE